MITITKEEACVVYDLLSPIRVVDIPEEDFETYVAVLKKLKRLL